MKNITEISKLSQESKVCIENTEKMRQKKR